LSAMQRSC